VLAQAKSHLSDEHFTVDGTLIEAWASQKSFQKKDGGDDDPGQFRGQKRSNDTHESKTDPDARRYRKGNGQEAKLGYLGHMLMENRHGLIVDAMLTHADGTAERDAALLMMRWRKRRQQRRRGPGSRRSKRPKGGCASKNGVFQHAKWPPPVTSLQIHLFSLEMASPSQAPVSRNCLFQQVPSETRLPLLPYAGRKTT
jgi:hypothetical protein